MAYVQLLLAEIIASRDLVENLSWSTRFPSAVRERICQQLFHQRTCVCTDSDCTTALLSRFNVACSVHFFSRTVQLCLENRNTTEKCPFHFKDVLLEVSTGQKFEHFTVLPECASKWAQRNANGCRTCSVRELWSRNVHENAKLRTKWVIKQGEQASSFSCAALSILHLHRE